jgi:oligopeptide transport system substrate-binding protein
LLAADESVKSFMQVLHQALETLHQKTKQQHILRIALDQGPLFISLDPRIGGDVTSGHVLRLVFEGLTRFNQNGEIENAIAETIEISPNMQQYIFNLRPSLWNDGSQVTAFDFEYAWKKILSPDFKTSFAYLFYPIKNAKEAKDNKASPDQIGIHVIDDHKLLVELVRPNPYFLQFMAHHLYSPVHRLLDQQNPEWIYQCEKNYPCNGPFQLKINQPNLGYQLTKNPFYRETNKITLDQIILTEMNPTQAIQAFQQKEIDWVGNPFGSWHPIYNNQKEGTVISFFNNWICWCIFNTTYTPFHHSKLRQAFSYVINRTKMIAETFQPLEPAYSLLLPHQNSLARFPDHDVGRAQQLFNEALQELNLSKEYFSLIKFTFFKFGIQPHIALCLKQQFKECLDIDFNLEPLPFKEVFNKMIQGNYQIGLMNWASAVDDPLYCLNVFKTAKEDINLAKWENSNFQRFVNLSEQEINLFKRSSYLLNAEKILIKEMPAIPLYYPSHQALVSKNLNINFGAFLNIARNIYKV